MVVIVIVIVVVVVTRVIVGRRGLARATHTLGASTLRDRRAATARLVAPAALFELVGVVAGENDRDVRGALADAEVAAAGTGLTRLARRPLVGPRAREVELVGRERVVVLGVGDRGVEQLQHVVGGVLLAELEHTDRVVDRETAHEVEDLADLVRRDRQVPDRRAGVRGVDGDCHQRRTERSCPA